MLVLVQTTSVSRSGIFPSTLFGFLSVIIVVIHECKWYIATIEPPVISKSLFFFKIVGRHETFKAPINGRWPSPPTGSVEQPKLGGVLFSVIQQPWFDVSHPYRLSIHFFRCMWQVGLFFFLGGGEGGWKEVLGHSALQKWNTVNHYPILQRSASTYHESQSLHDILISSCLITLHALSFRSTSKNSRDSILCVILCVHKNVVFWSPSSHAFCANSECQEVVLEPSLEMNLRGRTWDLRFE